MIDEKSIAVLPFDNMSSDPENEYFSDGMTEEIINALSRIDGLKVTARTSSFVFKHQKQDVRKIGKDLGVSLVLEGSVRKSGERLRITAQLIRTNDGFHIWSENFDRKLTDIFELQDEISLLIADKIREHFGHLHIQEHLVDVLTDNIEAYQLFLKGRYYHNQWNMADFSRAAEYYKQSIAEDPNFDFPYFGAGLSYSFLGSWGAMEKQAAFQLANDAFKQGRQLNKKSAYGFYCEAKHQFWGFWDYKNGHNTLLKALEINPKDSNINEFMAEINTTLGDFPTALQHIETSLSISPLSPNHYYTIANIYYLQGQFQQALQFLEKALTLDPNFAVVIELKLACLIHLGLYEDLQKSLQEYQSLPIIELYELIYQLFHHQEGVDEQLVNITVEKIQLTEPALLLAWDLFLLVYAGNLREAIELLEVKTSQKMGQVINFKHEPFLLPLRDFKEYQELTQQYFPLNSLQTIEISKLSDRELLTAEEITLYADSLLTGMEQEKYFLSAGLSLKELAEKVDLHPNKLSWLLNEKLKKNFYDFVNSYRLKEFQRLALDQSNKHLNLLGLAYESGFNSKSVFNDYFKKTTGLTPKAWLSQQQ